MRTTQTKHQRFLWCSPKVGVVSAVESFADPILHLYGKAKRFVQGGKCEVFYNGAVEQPR
jgi:hypothetical protein